MCMYVCMYVCMYISMHEMCMNVCILKQRKYHYFINLVVTKQLITPANSRKSLLTSEDQSSYILKRLL